MFSRILVSFLSLSLFLPIYSEEIEEIVVTALKRSSTVADTPASITAAPQRLKIKALQICMILNTWFLV